MGDSKYLVSIMEPNIPKLRFDRATIVKAELGFGDAQFMHFILMLKVGNKTCKFDQRLGTGMALLRKLFVTVGVNEWGELVGRNVRVRRNTKDILDIGNEIDDVWLIEAEQSIR
jgi:hypothetical protein